MTKLSELKQMWKESRDVQRNVKAMLDFQALPYKWVQDDLLLDLSSKAPKDGESFDGRKHKLDKTFIHFFKGLVKILQLKSDGTPVHWANRYTAQMERQITRKELMTVTGLSRHQVDLCLHKMVASGALHRRLEKTGSRGAMTTLLYLRWNAGKLCAMFTKAWAKSHPEEGSKTSGEQRPVNRTESVNTSNCAAGEPGIAYCSIGAADQSAACDLVAKKKTSAAPLIVLQNQPDATNCRAARQSTCPPAGETDKKSEAGLRTRSNETGNPGCPESEDFRQAITKLYKRAFPEATVKPSTRRWFWRYHVYLEGHRRFNSENVNRWLEGLSNATIEFDTWHKTPEDLARSWIKVMDKMDRGALMRFFTPKPAQWLCEKDEAVKYLSWYDERAITQYEQERHLVAMRYYRFTNSEPSKLGREPLPDGEVKAFRLVTDDKLYAFVGRTVVKYIPVNETVEMELGKDLEVLVKPTLMNWEKTNLQFDGDGNVKGWTVKETWQVEVQNSQDIDVVLDVRRNFTGDWSLQTAAAYEKVDANKVKFVLPLKAREKRLFRYDLTTHFGSNATR